MRTVSRANRRHFAAGGNLMPESSCIRLCVVPGLEHALTAAWMHQTAAAQIIRFLEDHQVDTGFIKAEREHQNGYA
jgi:hypothetical protein